MEYPVPFEINKEGELTVKIDGEVHILDPKNGNRKDIAEQESVLINNLPIIPWDTYCAGVKRKQQETCAAYKIVIVNSALGGLYKENIKNLLLDYNFNNLRSNSSNGETFSSLLKTLEQDAGSVTKFLLACCTILLTSKKNIGRKNIYWHSSRKRRNVD
jgi:hypothetical protein